MERVSWYVLEGSQMFKQPLAAQHPSCPEDHMICTGGLFPFSSV